MRFSTIAFASTLIVSALSSIAAAPWPLTAVAYVTSPGSTAITGTVRFSQEHPGANTWVQVNVTGLPAGDHGIHVHQFGDLSGGCETAGAHFNPFNHTHGGPDAKIRHVGDYGNLVAPTEGPAFLKLESDSTTLWGPHSFIGRAVVIHSGQDDLGLGGTPLSNTTGNSGTRVACGVIGTLNA